jgi:hypothetical protein
VDDAAKAALIAYLEAQVLSANTLLAELAGEPADEPEVDETPRPAPRKKAPPKKAVPAAVEDDDDDDSDADEDTSDRQAELEAMKITALKALAIKRGFNEDGVKAATKPELVDAILVDEKGDDADEDTTDEDDESGDDEVTYTRDELTDMGIRKAKALAMEKGHTVADLKGLKLAEVVDLILDEGDAAEDDDADEDEGDADEGDYYTRADYLKMSLAELKVIARAYQKDDPSFKFPANIQKPALIDLLMEGYE